MKFKVQDLTPQLFYSSPWSETRFRGMENLADMVVCAVIVVVPSS